MDKGEYIFVIAPNGTTFLDVEKDRFREEWEKTVAKVKANGMDLSKIKIVPERRGC